MGKTEEKDLKKAEKKARKRAKKEAKKEAKEAKRAKKELERRMKELNRQEKHARKKRKESDSSENVTISSFYKKEIDVTISVLPSAMGNALAAIEDSIRLMLLKYTEDVGVMLSFHNIRIISNSGNGMILFELPHIHYHVRFDALVFCPKVGSKLCGKVAECFPSHVSVLVLDYFNAMIPATQLQDSGFSYNQESQDWSRDSDDQKISAGDYVSFVVDKIHECEGILSLEGSKPTIALKSSMLEMEFGHLLSPSLGSPNFRATAVH